jgi:hypothetical protein
MSVQGLGGFQVGAVLAALWQQQLDKTGVAITRGKIIAMDASQNWEVATAGGGTHINKFAFAANAPTATDAKVFAAGPLSLVVAEVPSGSTCTPGKECVISPTAGMVADRAAEALNKVVGDIKGTPAMIGGDTVEAAIAGPAPVIIQLRAWGGVP